MRSFRTLAAYALTRSPRTVASRVWNELARLPSDLRQRRLDREFGTYIVSVDRHPLSRLVQGPGPAFLAPHAETLLDLARGALAHEFDLLGSGPVVVRHGMLCSGLRQHRFPPGPAARAGKPGAWLEALVNSANLREAQ